MFLIPLAVGLITSSVEGPAAIVYACQQIQYGTSKSIETKFNSYDLLIKTLREQGISYKEKSQNTIEAHFKDGNIRYERKNESSPYTMKLYHVKNTDDLICSIEKINEVYGSNVQRYTYNRVKNNLPENMELSSEEILDDNSILLTITVDD